MTGCVLLGLSQQLSLGFLQKEALLSFQVLESLA